VKTQPIYITFGNFRAVENELFANRPTVWPYGNTLYINVIKDDIASIYSVAGLLVKRIEVPEGGTTLPLAKGAYIVTLKDGSVHKVIIR